MPYAIGTLTKEPSGTDVHYQLMQIIHDLGVSAGYEVLRFNTSTADHELIFKAPGLSGTEEIFFGFKTYQNFASDYYNIDVRCFIGYEPSSSFENQPGVTGGGMNAHNVQITYYISANAQRMVLMLKVGTPIYSHAYVGKILPYARPSQNPYPVCVATSYNGKEARRFSDTNTYWPYHGPVISSQGYLRIRTPSGIYEAPTVFPFTNKIAIHGCLASTTGGAKLYCLVSNNSTYDLIPLILYTNNSSLNEGNLWGEMDGVYFCSGFSNLSENVVQCGGSSIVDITGMSQLQAVQAIHDVGGRAYIIGQNIHRTAWRDYIAIEMSE